MYCIAIAAINSASTCAITKAPDLPKLSFRKNY